MSEVDSLLQGYERFVRLPWSATLAGPQRVWFLIYNPAQERRVRLRLPAFEQATAAAGHDWRLLDITDMFAQWMAGHDYRERYFSRPLLMEPALEKFADAAADAVIERLQGPDVTGDAVVALVGVASLFGLTRASRLIERVAPSIRGRLLVFFPGHHEGSNYRLLDARDGWNYLAVPITASNES